MCGIIGYIGKRNATEVLINGLKALEYRGYDSAGIAVIDKEMMLKKAVGRVANIENIELKGTLGLGHTRWATHGDPSEKNAHPHLSSSGKIAIVHNGIIENYLELKEVLKECEFKSDTDSEVFAHLFEKNYSGSLKDAVAESLKHIIGTYAVCAIHLDTREIVVARNGSPIVLGVGDGENFIASDVSALIEHTKEVIYLEDFELAVVKEDSITIYDKSGKDIKKQSQKVDWDLEKSQKGGYSHFMLKEINEQPAIVKDSLSIPIDADIKANKIFIVACGTALYTGHVGKYIIEKLTRTPVQIENASEFRYMDPIIGKGDLLIVVSQSGETADTLAAIRIAKEKGAKTLGIINVKDSTIAREVDDVIYTRAGPEIGVASTKAVISQLIVFYKMAEKMSGISLDLDTIPDKIQSILDDAEKIKKVAGNYYRVYNFLYIGRCFNYPIALEGALKLKEISYIHAEGYAAGEMKHGPIALVTDEVPTVAIAPDDSVYPKMISNIEEIKARHGDTIVIATEGNEKVKQHATDVIYIPKTEEELYPLLTVVAVQLLAYHIADFRDCDIDKPRNLAKSVTVE